MSLILDALNRARAERGEEEAPPLAPPAAAAAPSSRRVVVILSLALAASCVLLTWFVVDRFRVAAPAQGEGTDAAEIRSPGPPPAAEEKAFAGQVAGAEAPAAAAQSDRDAEPPPLASAVAALYRDTSGSATASPDEVVPGTAAPADVRVNRAPPEAAGDPAPREKAIDVAEVLARARRELGEPALAPHPAPLIAELSQQQKDAIPTLMYLRHDYTGDGRSRVQLNGEPRAAGDSVDGVRVEEILRDSVVLRHRDTLFRLRALNSWVNL